MCILERASTFCSREGIFETGAIFGRVATLVGPLQRKTENNRYFRGAISFGIVGI